MATPSASDETNSLSFLLSIATDSKKEVLMCRITVFEYRELRSRSGSTPFACLMSRPRVHCEMRSRCPQDVRESPSKPSRRYDNTRPAETKNQVLVRARRWIFAFNA
jgi:hypothetical protein